MKSSTYILNTLLLTALISCNNAEENTSSEQQDMNTPEQTETVQTEMRIPEKSEEEIWMEEQLAFLDVFPDVITDREDMKEILKQTGFVSNDPKDENTRLHYVHYENGECVYDPCNDYSGWSWFMNEQEEDVDLSFTGVDSAEMPAFYYSSQDTYLYKISQFERTEYGVSFNLENQLRYVNDRHYIFLSEDGYWLYQIVQNGSDYSYMVTAETLDEIRHLEDDCPEEGW